jgi:hypothetical protein
MSAIDPEATGRRRPGASRKTIRRKTPLTISVPEAGELYFGLSKNGSYEAAARGDIPVVKIGKLLRVPVRLMEKMLDRASSKLTAAE